MVQVDIVNLELTGVHLDDEVDVVNEPGEGTVKNTYSPAEYDDPPLELRTAVNGRVEELPTLVGFGVTVKLEKVVAVQGVVHTKLTEQ